MGSAFACIRPDENKDVNLYIPREEDKELSIIINSFLKSAGTRRCLLIKGQRGIGKSICTRAIINQIQAKEPQKFFPIIVAGDRSQTFKDLIVDISETLSDAVGKLYPADESLLTQVSDLTEILDCDHITQSELRNRGTAIEVKLGLDYGVLGFIKTRLGGSLDAHGDTTIGKEITISMNNQRRIKLLSKVLSSISLQKKIEPLLFIDNLDQITENKRIQDIMKNLLWIDNIPLIITVRTEFVSKDILREHNDPINFNPLSSEQLIAILKKRLEACGLYDESENNYNIILQVGQELTKATNNPWAFLRWLNYLCRHTELTYDNFLSSLVSGYIGDYHELAIEDLHVTDKGPLLFQMAKWFHKNKISYASRENITKEFNLRDTYIDILEEQGVIIPRDVTIKNAENQLYTLSPLLQFLRLHGE